jgi:hypothetical protein
LPLANHGEDVNLPPMACEYRPNHRIYMSFFLRSGWYVSFLEPDLKTPLPRKFNFGSPDKIRELAQRGGALSTLEGKQMLDHAIETGRGGLYLNLTHEQYAKLTRPCALGEEDAHES